MTRVGVIGAGAWGTALAVAVRRAGHEVRLWSHDPAVAATVAATRENPLYLPGVTLDPGIAATADARAAVDADVVLLVTPAQHLRAVCGGLAAAWRPDVPAVVCAKGIEQETGALMTDVLREVLPQAPRLVLSGPTFAAEVARGLPAAATLAGEDAGLAERLTDVLGTRRFRLYHSADPIGAQVGGAVKNVIAVAAGVVEGRGLGDNARAALITRGLAEIGRLAQALGGDARTLMGLSGLGDLTLTCGGRQSRNFSLGIALGEGRTLAEVVAGRRSVAEGVHTARSIGIVARRAAVEMPICAAVEAVLHGGAGIDDTIEGLLARPFTAEARP